MYRILASQSHCASDFAIILSNLFLRQLWKTSAACRGGFPWLPWLPVDSNQSRLSANWLVACVQPGELPCPEATFDSAVEPTSALTPYIPIQQVLREYFLLAFIVGIE